MSFKDQAILKLILSSVIVCSDCSAENIFNCASGPIRGSRGFPAVRSVVAWPTCYSYLSTIEADEFCGMLNCFPIGHLWKKQMLCDVISAVAVGW